MTDKYKLIGKPTRFKLNDDNVYLKRVKNDVIFYKKSKDLNNLNIDTESIVTQDGVYQLG